MLATAPLADMKIQLAEPQRISGGPGYEIRAQATAVRGEPVSPVQWVRFGGTGFLRIIGVTARPNPGRDVHPLPSCARRRRVSRRS